MGEGQISVCVYIQIYIYIVYFIIIYYIYIPNYIVYIYIYLCPRAWAIYLGNGYLQVVQGCPSDPDRKQLA